MGKLKLRRSSRIVATKSERQIFKRTRKPAKPNQFRDEVQSLLSAAPTQETPIETYERIKPLLMPKHQGKAVAIAHGKLVSIKQDHCEALQEAAEMFPDLPSIHECFVLITPCRWCLYARRRPPPKINQKKNQWTSGP